jgi:MFS family permease
VRVSLRAVPAATASVVERIAPARLGRRFRWLFASAVASNIGDGIALAAGPLLIASQTSDAFLISMGYLVQILPSLLFSVVAGTAADRFDRRTIAIWLNLARASSWASSR